MTNTTETETLSKSQIIWRGIRGCCPKCGEGKLFKSYLKQMDHCAHCAEELGTIRADDGPAWLSVFLTCHVIAPLIGYFALHDVLSLWAAAAILIVITVSVALVLLPRTKGFFIAALWLTSQKKKGL